MILPDGFSYNEIFLPSDEERALLQTIQELSFTHDQFRGQQLKRRYAQFGYAYASIGRKLNPAPAFPSFLCALVERAMPDCPPDTRFDQCIITHYPGGAGIGWHTDAPSFGECIIAVSVGGSARLQFRPNGTKDATGEITVVPGSLYVMTGPARWEYQHQVVPVKTDRYSLTIRHVVTGER